MIRKLIRLGLVGALTVSGGCVGSRHFTFKSTVPQIEEYCELESTPNPRQAHGPQRSPVPDQSRPQGFAAVGTHQGVFPRSPAESPERPLAEFRQVAMRGEDMDPQVELIPTRPDSLRISGYEVSRKINLNQVISLALVADPVLLAGFESINQADAEAITASLKPNPVLSVDQTLLPLTRPFIADEREGGPPQLDVILEYPIDWYLFGKRTAEIQSAQWGMRVSQSEFADLGVSVTFVGDF